MTTLPTPTTASPAPATAARPYVASLAGTPEETRAAQRLRHLVFAEERGARLDSPLAGHDVDPFDDVMDHLVVTDTASGEVVGTYRLLPPGRGERLFSDREFDLTGLPGAVRSGMVEAGRACVHPGHRSGAVITLMWSALARYVLLSGHRYLAGCASVPLSDGGQAAADALVLAGAACAAPPELRVTPRTPWSPDPHVRGVARRAGLPPLLRGYLRAGAWLCGPPHHERDFGDADFFVLLDTEAMNSRYRRYFLAEDEQC